MSNGMFRAILGVAVCLAFFGAGMAQQKAPPSKHAVLIVNYSYQKLPPLASPSLDRAALEDALRKTGFEVKVFENNLVAADQFDDDFVRQILPGDIVLMFYSGYAVQSKMDNFLLPVSFDPQQTDPLVSAAISLRRLQEDLEDQKPSLKIVLVDAARDERALDAISASTGLGLVAPDVSGSETLFLFSAPLNQTAPAVPVSSAGVLAAAFAKAIVQPDSSLGNTIREVVAALGNRPFLSNQVAHTFYFTPPPPPPPTAPPPDLFTKIPQSHKPDREEYKFIEKGTFQMGCVPASTCDAAEKPRHEVHITKSFWMAVTDVTAAAYQRFLAQNKGRKKPVPPFWAKMKDWSEFHPVVNVSWEDAVAYCQWVGGRLPTEAEWEYAARAAKPDEAFPLDSANSRDKANFSGRKGNDVYEYTSPVKSFDPTPWGLFDMAGNVWQWTADWFSPAYYGNSPADDPGGPDTGKERVARGGSFSSDPAKHLRISYREKFDPSKGEDNVGFRCVLDDGPETRARFATGK
jgi:formylglycine-generating enzyme required for sulfatase activity